MAKILGQISVDPALDEPIASLEGDIFYQFVDIYLTATADQTTDTFNKFSVVKFMSVANLIQHGECFTSLSLVSHISVDSLVLTLSDASLAVVQILSASIFNTNLVYISLYEDVKIASVQATISVTVMDCQLSNDWEVVSKNATQLYSSDFHLNVLLTMDCHNALQTTRKSVVDIDLYKFLSLTGVDSINSTLVAITGERDLFALLWMKQLTTCSFVLHSKIEIQSSFLETNTEVKSELSLPAELKSHMTQTTAGLKHLWLEDHLSNSLVIQETQLDIAHLSRIMAFHSEVLSEGEIYAHLRSLEVRLACNSVISKSVLFSEITKLINLGMSIVEQGTVEPVLTPFKPLYTSPIEHSVSTPAHMLIISTLDSYPVQLERGRAFLERESTLSCHLANSITSIDRAYIAQLIDCNSSIVTKSITAPAGMFFFSRFRSFLALQHSSVDVATLHETTRLLQADKPGETVSDTTFRAEVHLSTSSLQLEELDSEMYLITRLTILQVETITDTVPVLRTTKKLVSIENDQITDILAFIYDTVPLSSSITEISDQVNFLWINGKFMVSHITELTDQSTHMPEFQRLKLLEHIISVTDTPRAFIDEITALHVSIDQLESSSSYLTALFPMRSTLSMIQLTSQLSLIQERSDFSSHITTLTETFGHIIYVYLGLSSTNVTSITNIDSLILTDKYLWSHNITSINSVEAQLAEAVNFVSSLVQITDVFCTMGWNIESHITQINSCYAHLRTTSYGVITKPSIEVYF